MLFHLGAYAVLTRRNRYQWLTTRAVETLLFDTCTGQGVEELEEADESEDEEDEEDEVDGDPRS